MPPKPAAGKKTAGAGAGSGSGCDARLLHDIKTLSKALSIESKKVNPSRSISANRPNPNPNPKSDSKKQSFWKSWKPLRALSQSRSRRFDCRFSLHVHSVDNLPAFFSGSSLVVSWKRTTDPASASSTRPARVVDSSASFEELLSYCCLVHGTRSGSNGSAKYEPRHFLVWVSVEGSPGIDLGRNLVDLTRLFPLSLEELEEESSTGKWSTRFKLSGKGKGAEIGVSFGFSLAGDGPGSGRVHRSQSVENVKVLREAKEEEEKESEDPEFTVVEGGIEIAPKDPIFEPKLERADFEINADEEIDWEKLKSPKTYRRMSLDEVKSSYKVGGPRSRSLSLDDEAVASEFLNMLGLSSESEPESPRERSWKQFDWADADFAEDFDLSAIVREAEAELQMAMEAMDSKSRAKLMEDAETEALMYQYGIDEKAFQSSTHGKSSGFGSPIEVPSEEPLDLPPLCEGLGPFVQTKDGGFLRSMSPSLFKNAKNDGHLIMQVSSPVVVPAEMGSGIMEILQRLASVGIEKLSMQAKKLMPLEDITGNTMQQMAWEAAPALEVCERHYQPQHLKASIESAVGQFASRGSKRGRSPNRASSSAEETESEYVSIEDLAPLAMDKIEALSIEGLRIQSGMSNEEAPSNISPQSIGEISALEGKGAMNSMYLGMEGTGGLQLLDVKDGGDELDGLMGLSITLDEWMRLDSGIVDEEDISDRTSKVLAAHHARATDMTTGGSKRGGRRTGKRWGLLGNNFTVALMVQLRDPLRNYEPVGTPMLSLIQVERVFVPPKPKIYRTVSEKGNSEEPDEPETKTEVASSEDNKEDVIPQFKIMEVHIAGLKTEPGEKKLWGNPVQQQSCSRWLLATGMGKSNKHPFMKSKASSKSTAENLWSVSSCVHGNGAKWKELHALNPHTRNPNVIFPNKTIKLK